MSSSEAGHVDGHGNNPNIMPCDSASSPFFRLPRELRDQIYHDIWRRKPRFDVSLPDKGDHHIAGQYHGRKERYHMFQIVYQSIPTPLPQNKVVRYDSPIDYDAGQAAKKKDEEFTNPAPWILTNKQILHEAMQQFTYQATWIYSVSNLGRSTQQLAAWRLPSTPRGAPRFSPILLALRNAAKIHFPTQFELSVFAVMGQKGAPFMKVDLSTTAKAILQHMKADLNGATSVNRLSLNLRATTWWTESRGFHVDVDLHGLHSLNLPNVRLLELSVILNDKFSANEKLVGDLREAIVQAGRQIVGGGEREVFVESFGSDVATSLYWTYEFRRC